MDFFTGFNWAVPRAFSEALNLCCFEEGDVLYDTAKAYDHDWGVAKESIEYSLQVKYPPKLQRGVLEKGQNLFIKNWDSEVSFVLFNRFQQVAAGQIMTTQGRLYTVLWKGDLTILDINTSKPPIPLLVNKTRERLKELSTKAVEIAAGASLFVMPCDFSNSYSKAKFVKVSSALSNYLQQSPIRLSAQMAGLADYEKIAPTVEIAFFPVTNMANSELEVLIKKAVYIKTKNAITERFNVHQHGEIFYTKDGVTAMLPRPPKKQKIKRFSATHQAAE